MFTAPPAFAFYGDVVMNRTAKRFGFPAVVFPHWAHRIQFTCRACHPGIFRMEAGAHEILMERMTARRTFCAACHDGKIAWKPVNCARCHRTDDRFSPRQAESPATLRSPGPPFARENGDPEVVLRPFPRDPGGNIDWMEAQRRGLIAPRSSLTASRTRKQTVPPDSLMRRTETLPPVVFPHSSHAQWLDCRNCHPAPFVPKAGANEISMAKIQAGQYCGACHGKVAFPVKECQRCHQGAK